MRRVFIYWNNSNIHHEAQRLAEDRNSGPDARYRVRIEFSNMYRLAHADRPVERAVAAGSIPPEMRHLWNRLDNFYDSVTFLEPSRPGHLLAQSRDAVPIDLARRTMA